VSLGLGFYTESGRLKPELHACFSQVRSSAFRLRISGQAKACTPNLAGRAGQAVAEGVNSELEAVGHAELAVNRSEMMAHRHVGDEQLAGDLFVPESLGHDRNELSLPSREGGNPGSLGIAFKCSVRVRQ